MLLIQDAHIINEGRAFKGSVLVDGEVISKIFESGTPISVPEGTEVIDASSCFLIPGVIDTHVHFRDPGLTQKADFESESMAAVAGGVTTVFDMPNTKPQTVSRALLDEKIKIAEAKSYCNYAFYIGATNDNLDELLAADYSKICGVKLFLGSSTGGMLVQDQTVLESVFAKIKSVIVVHAEDEAVIARNKAHFMKLYGDEVPIECHPLVRSAEACFKSSSFAVSLAKKYGTRLHLAHISTEEELSLLSQKGVDEKLITAETCPHYLYFSDLDYKQKGAAIKCNPAIKTVGDRESLLLAISSNKIDTVATDHAPHLLSDKQGYLFTAASGMPTIQFSLLAMVELSLKGHFSMEDLVWKMCHNPATIFKVKDRGFIREGYKADLTLIDRTKKCVVTPSVIKSKCGWSPFTGTEFSTSVACTIVNGKVVCRNGAVEGRNAEAVTFEN